jgi:hypothetical protein
MNTVIGGSASMPAAPTEPGRFQRSNQRTTSRTWSMRGPGKARSGP